MLLQGGTRTLDRISTAQTGGPGLNAGGCARLDYGTVAVRNASTNPAVTLRRAVTVENNTQVLGTRLWITDTQTKPTGYVLGAYGTQKGHLGTVFAQISGRAVAIENASGLGYTLVQ